MDQATSNRLSLTFRTVCDEETAEARGTAKVVAVTRFDGVNAGELTIMLFDSKGSPAGNVSTTDKGIAVLRLPRGQPAYAWTKHIEAKSGSDPVSGKPFDKIAHYASHTMQVC